MKVKEMWTSNNRIVNQRMTTETISRPLHLFYLCSFERKRHCIRLSSHWQNWGFDAKDLHFKQKKHDPLKYRPENSSFDA